MKIGICCMAIVKKYGYERAFALCRESGFDAVDLDLQFYGKRNAPPDIYSASEDQFEEHFTNIGRLAREAGLEISSTHGRDVTYTPEKEQCDYIRWVSERDLKATALVGAPTCVIHSIVSTHWKDRPADDAEFFYRKNTELFHDVLPFAEANNVKIGMETYAVSFFAQAEHIKRQLELLNSKNMTVCIDTGHTNVHNKQGGLSPADMIRAFGKDVSILHLHDNGGTSDMHAPPICDRRGCVDWPDVFDALEEIGYTGSYNFELRFNFYRDAMEDAVRFYGKWLRYFVENKGRTY